MTTATTVSELRARARASLDNSIFSSNWLTVMLVLAVISILSNGVANVIPVVGWLLLYGPFSLGSAALLLGLIRTKKTELKNAAVGFTDSDLAGSIMLGMFTQIFIVLGFIVFVIPGVILSYSYSMVYFIKRDHPELGWRACQEESRRMMNGYRMKLFTLDLSFIGWYIVGALVFGIGTLWVNAYHMTARAEFYEDIKDVADITR